jgi:hypothetical protein
VSAVSHCIRKAPEPALIQESGLMSPRQIAESGRCQGLDDASNGVLLQSKPPPSFEKGVRPRTTTALRGCVP